MKRTYRPVVEILESRLAPAAVGTGGSGGAASADFGLPWPSHQLTISFVRDGTLVGGQQSQLFSSLNAEMPTSVWEAQVLRAFQTWAASANLNISVVADDGEPLGAPGPLQGDPNFGDIRIAAVPGGTSLASGIPLTPAAGTWSGDVIFNSTVPFGLGNSASYYDLFSVAVHEAGHALGLADDLDASSVMFSYYNYRTGLSNTDIQLIQALYGARPADTVGNSMQTATPFALAALTQYIGQFTNPAQTYGSLPPLAVNGNLSTSSDVDDFAYTSAPGDSDFAIELHTFGISSLEAEITVRDARGHVVASMAASDPLDGDLSMRVIGVHGSSQIYYIEVQGATGDVFSTGSYQLQIVPASALPLLPFKLVDVLASFLPPPNNHSLARATTLQANGPTTFSANGQLGSSGEVDYYRLVAPPPDEAGLPESMTVMVSGRQGSTLDPTVNVYDSRGQLVNAEVIAAGNGNDIVSVQDAQPGATYYVSVQAAAGATGAYSLGVSYSTVPDGTQLFTSGQLSAASMQDFRSIVLQQNMLFHFDVSALTPGAGVPTAVEITLFDLTGNVLGDWTVFNGQPLSVNLYLPAGGYTFRFVGGTQDGSPLPATTYSISGYAVNDPIGPPLVPPTATPPPPPIPFQWLQSALYQVLALVDPYGHPLPTQAY